MARAIISLVPSPAEATFAVVQITPKLHGRPTKHWNERFRHWEWEQPTQDEFRCVDCWSVRAADAVPRLEAALAAGRDVRIGGEPVEFRIVVDRNEVGDPLVHELWNACVRQQATGCIVLDVRTDVRTERLQPRIVKLKGGDAGVSDGIAARDVAEALREMRRTGRLVLSPSAAEYGTLVEEMEGFDGQTARRRARALSLALWCGYTSPSGNVAADGAAQGMPRVSEAEDEMLANALRNAEPDEDAGHEMEVD